MARVLVVENDPATRMLLTLHLESETHDVITAVDGEEGLQRAFDSHPDLILSDSCMPRVDGIDMLTGIRADARTAAIPFIFLTDFEDRDVRARSRALMVADYLVKPFDRESLLEAVSRQVPQPDRRRDPIDEPEPEDDDQSATMAMAPEYAAPLPGTDALVRDATSRSVDGTVMFFAIRDFNRIAEILGDDLQLELINAFHENVRDLLARSSGWIVKTIEGGFIAMFEDGVTSGTHHAERAAKTAILCVLALHRFGPWVGKKLGHTNIPALVAVAGLNSGQISVCSLSGGRAGRKSERTIIGDIVNVASRLQSGAGELGWGIVCSEATLAGAGARFGSGREGRIAVKGRRTPVKVIELISLRPKAGGDADDRAFYAEVGRTIDANTRLIEAQNAMRHGETVEVSIPEVPTFSEASSLEEAPITVEGYQVLRKVGEGGAAAVHLARHSQTGESRVLKLVRLSDENDGEAAKRFVQEYALLMQVSHPNVARVFQHGHEGGYAYMAMEYFPGGDLRSLMRRPCEPAMAVAALIQVARGITAVHRTGVVHRDLKPDNVMIRADGSLAIADFGIAKKIGAALGPTQHGDILGTPYYLSPEQVLGQSADHRADIYSLGVMFYEMLTGERAYAAQSVMELMRHHTHSPVPALRESLDRFQPLLERMMSKDRDRRFGGAWEIEDFLTQYRLI